MFCQASQRITAAIITATASAVALPAQSRTPAPIAVISLGSYPENPNLLTVHATVNGHDGNFLFDTGEGMAMISPQMAQTIGCKPWGQITGFRMTGERIDAPHCDDITFDIAGQKLAAPSAIVFDIMKFFPPDKPRLDGSLGLDIFASRAITFQFSRKSIVVESPESLASRIAHSTEMPLRIVRDAGGVALTVDIGVPTPDGIAWMELDSGGGNSIIIGKHIAALLNLDPESTALQQVKFTIAGKIPVDAPACVLNNIIMDGNINVPFLKNWDVTLDLAKGKAWAAAAGVE